MTEPKEVELTMSHESMMKYAYLFGKVDAVQHIRIEAKKVFDDPNNFIVKQDAYRELLDIIDEYVDKQIKG